MLNKKLGLIALITGVAASGVLATTDTITNFTTGDVLVCFQKGGVDMVVDAGPVSAFTGATHNQVIPITQYTGAQLAQVGTNSSVGRRSPGRATTRFSSPGPGLR